ncbi:MAG: hypothetical protein ACI9XO_004334, partial [Paraglaciecola sp.]
LQRFTLLVGRRVVPHFGRDHTIPIPNWVEQFTMNNVQ